MLIEQRNRVKTIPDPLERLINGGRAYVKFALKEPDYFQLMFNSMDYADVGGQFGKSGLAFFEEFRSNVAELVKRDYFDGENLDTIVLALWANFQGLAILVSTERVEAIGIDLDLDQLIKDVIEFQLRPGGSTSKS